MQNSKELAKDNSDKKLSILLVMILFVPILTNFIGSILLKFNLDTSLSTIVIYSIVIIYSLYAYFFPRIRINNKKLALYIIVILLFIFNFFIFQNTRIYFQLNIVHLITLFLIYFPMALNINKIHNWKIFLKYINVLAYITPILIVIAVSFFDIDKMTNYMVLANAILPGMLGLYLSLRNYNKSFISLFIKICFLILYLYLMVIYGGRMSLISSFIFIALVEFIQFKFSPKNTKTMRLFYYLVFITMIIVSVSLSSNFILTTIKNSDMFSNSYIIQNWLKNELFSSSSRLEIYNNAINEIKEMGLKTYGFFGDRVVMERYDFLEGPAIYVHNIFLEFLLQFGIVFGSLFCLYLILLILKSIISPKNRFIGFVSCYFFSLIFLRLLVSGSYLIEGQFIIYLGVLLYNYKGYFKYEKK